MKQLSIKQILITILISYLCISFVNAELNPLKLNVAIRAIQTFVIIISLAIQWGIKNTL